MRHHINKIINSIDENLTLFFLIELQTYATTIAETKVPKKAKVRIEPMFLKKCL